MKIRAAWVATVNVLSFLGLGVAAQSAGLEMPWWGWAAAGAGWGVLLLGLQLGPPQSTEKE